MVHLTEVFPESKCKKELERLYNASFPENERTILLPLLGGMEGYAQTLAILDEQERFCGFFSILEVGTMSHIIYFAIEEGLRDRGYGSAALDAVKKLKKGLRILVDIESPEQKGIPNAEQRRRRKAFYTKNGFEQTPVHYPWQGDDYEILSVGGSVTDAEWAHFWEVIDTVRQCPADQI